MISPYHQQIADHYERFPYPHYPWFGLGSWKQLESVDLSNWPMARDLRDLWIAGCGTIAPLMFGRRNPSVSILATDISRAALKRLRLRLNLHGVRNVRLEHEDLISSHYTECFDAIDCFGVIHHTFSPQLALEKLSRALRVGGVLRLMVYSREARGEIEKLRAEVRESKLDSFSQIRELIQSRGVALKGDLRSRSGIADALLNPIVQTYDEESLQALIKSQRTLDLIGIDNSSNYVAWLRRANR